jgi:agmatinase
MISTFSQEHRNMTSRDELLGHRESSMTFAGELSFLRRKVTQDISNADIVISGIPFDSATTNRPGARFGPQAIRAASVQLAELAEHAFPSGADLFADLAIADYGDCELPSAYPTQVVDRIFNHAQAILRHDAMMVSLGGDHFVTYPLLQAHAEKYGPLSLLHFDAHVDTWEDDGEQLDHGSMFLRAVREGIIVPGKSVQVGIRSFSDDDYGFTVLDSPWVHEHGPDNAVTRIREVIGDSPTYLTFDIDCLDPAFAPGTGTPVAGGLSSMQALTIIRQLGNMNFIGMDLVEVAPAYDHAEITAIAAATIIHDFIALMAKASQDDV